MFGAIITQQKHKNEHAEHDEQQGEEGVHDGGRSGGDRQEMQGPGRQLRHLHHEVRRQLLRSSRKNTCRLVVYRRLLLGTRPIRWWLGEQAAVLQEAGAGTHHRRALGLPPRASPGPTT